MASNVRMARSIAEVSVAGHQNAEANLSWIDVSPGPTGVCTLVVRAVVRKGVT